MSASSFINNYIKSSESATAFGIINFFGNSLFINETLLKFNRNRVCSGIFISSGKINRTIKIYKTIFISNLAFDYAPGFAIGENSFSISAYLETIACINNVGEGEKVVKING